MAVDLKPAVGRILLVRGRSTEFFPWFLKGGRITRISGQRAYYTKEDGTESFTHEYSAIVDTEEEEQALLKFTESAKQRMTELHIALTKESEELLADLQSVAKPAAQTIRRRRA